MPCWMRYWWRNDARRTRNGPTPNTDRMQEDNPAVSQWKPPRCVALDASCSRPIGCVLMCEFAKLVCISHIDTLVDALGVFLIWNDAPHLRCWQMQHKCKMAFGGSSGSGTAEFMQNQDINNTNTNLLFCAQVISFVKFHVHVHSTQGSQESSTPRSCMISSICLHCLCVVLWGIKVKLRKFDEKMWFWFFYLSPLVWNVFGLFWINVTICKRLSFWCQDLAKRGKGMIELCSFVCGLCFWAQSANILQAV